MKTVDTEEGVLFKGLSWITWCPLSHRCGGQASWLRSPGLPFLLAKPTSGVVQPLVHLTARPRTPEGPCVRDHWLWSCCEGIDSPASAIVQLLRCAWLFATPWTAARQASLSMGFSRQEHWSGLPFPSPGDLPDLRIELASPAWARRFFTTESPGKPRCIFSYGICSESLVLLEPLESLEWWVSFYVAEMNRGWGPQGASGWELVRKTMEWLGG